MLVLLPELWIAFVQPTFILNYFLKKDPADSSARHSLCLRENVTLGHPHQSKQSNGSVSHSFNKGNPLQVDASSTAFLRKLACNLTRTSRKWILPPNHKLFGNSHLYCGPWTFFLGNWSG